MRHALLVLLVLVAAGVDEEAPDPIDALTAAFNAHDVDAMLAVVTDDVEWLSVDGASIAVEARGKDALRAGMTGYFAALPSARSTAEERMASGRFVAVRERASWEADGRELSQASLAVYELREGKVARVWYYPAE